MKPYLEADMNVTIEFVQMADSKRSYLIIDEGDNENKTVMTGEKAEEIGVKIKNFLNDLFEEEA